MMLHVLPILCLISFIWLVEIRLKEQVLKIQKELEDLKSKIFENKDKIIENSKNISELKHEQSV